MNEQELNKKLAEWAGLEVHLTDTPTGQPEMWEVRPSSKSNVGWIDFTESLDACFKWLVPKLYNVAIFTNIAPSGDVFWNARIEAEYKTANTSETPALALCLAIEKLMESK